MLKGSAHITSGDARGGIEDQEHFLQRLDNSNNERTHRFLPKKSGHLQNKGENDQDDGRETLTLCSGHFVVPGAHEFDWVLEALNFLKSAWGTMVLKCHLSSPLDPVRSDHYFYHFFALLPHSRPESGHHNFL